MLHRVHISFRKIADICQNHHRPLLVLLLVLFTTAAYWRVAGNDFIRVYDDGTYVVNNSHIHHGLSIKSISWALTATRASNWHPLTWISHMLDWQLYGPNAAGHHITSLVFHLINTLLLLLVLYRMTGRFYRSLAVAALFALHPLHVESVAWIAERKDVLSTFFWLTTMLAYVHYSAGPNIKRYLLVLISFIFGLMSKPMLVSLPLVLLLVYYWPIKRMAVVGGESVPDLRVVGGISDPDLPSPSPTDSAPTIMVQPVVGGISDPDLPSPSPTDSAPTKGRIPSLHSSFIILNSTLLLLALASCTITFIAQHRGGAMGSLVQYPLGVRLANASVASVAYIGKMLLPRNLAIFYPHPGAGLPIWEVIGSILIIAALSALAIAAAKRRPYLTVGWFWYLITLIPVAGIVQVGQQAMADRYTYIPLIGLFIIIAWGIPDLVLRASDNPRCRAFVGAISTLAVLALAVFTYQQVGYWKNSETLFTHAIDVTRNNALAHYNLGLVLQQEGSTYEAADHYREVIRIGPDNPDARLNLGSVLMEQGSYDEAYPNFQAALRMNPKLAEAHAGIGIILASRKQYKEAIPHYEAALRIDYRNEKTHYNLGNALASTGKLDEAAAQYREAIRLNPKDAFAHHNLALAFQIQRRYSDAIREYRKAAQIAPDNPQILSSLAIAFYEAKDYAGAWQTVHQIQQLGTQPNSAFIKALSQKMPEPH